MSLLEAVKNKNAQQVREEIAKYELNRGMILQALVEASEKGYLEIVCILIGAGVNVNIETVYGTPLGQAAWQGHLDVVQKLIEAGADVNYSVNLSDNKSPLILAIQEGRFDVVKFLLEVGANVNQVVKESGEFALLTAAACGYEEIFNYLAPLTEPKLLQKAQEYLPEGIRQRQREEAADPLVCMLTSAVGNNNVDEVKEILAKGVDVNGFDEYGCRAILTAAFKKNASVVQLLLESGADPNLGDDEREQIPLTLAAGSRSEQSRLVCSLLIAAGADVNPKTDCGLTPLMRAAQFGNLEVTEMLIQFGADVNAQTYDGITPLMYATISGNLGITEMLIQFGADVSLKSIEGKTALIYAEVESKKDYSWTINARHQEVIELLRKIDNTND